MPNKDKNIPKRRFKEFENADAWELRKLGEVAEIVMGQSPDSKNYTDNPLDNILVQGNADLRDGCVVPRVWTTQVTKTAEKGDLILSVRAPVGDVGRTNYNVVLGRGVAGIKGNEFIYHLLVKMKLFGYWTKLSTGSTFESINSDDIKNSTILFPSHPEQEAIGTFFSTLDRHITLHQRKLDKLKSVKQAYLSEMFPAEGERVPKRRFPGFTDDWELRKFDECFNFPVSTNSLSRALLNYDEGDIKSVHYGDILIKYPAILNIKNDKIPYITGGKLEKYKSSLLENGDLIFADAAEDETVGKAVEVNGVLLQSFKSTIK